MSTSCFPLTLNFARAVVSESCVDWQKSGNGCSGKTQEEEVAIPGVGSSSVEFAVVRSVDSSGFYLGVTRSNPHRVPGWTSFLFCINSRRRRTQNLAKKGSHLHSLEPVRPLTSAVNTASFKDKVLE